MLKRIRIQGYKSLADLDLVLPGVEPLQEWDFATSDSAPPYALAVLIGSNAAGKSNFLDALHLLSRLATSRTIKDAFNPPYRGKPIDSFTFGAGGVAGRAKQNRLAFSIEADLLLSDSVALSVNQEIADMRHPGAFASGHRVARALPPVRERCLRYRVEIEMFPKSGVLRVADESLVALNREGRPKRSPRAYFGQQGEKIHLRQEGRADPTYVDRYLDHTILSMPHSPLQYPHLAAVRRELERWQFLHLEPQVRMRLPNALGEERQIGAMGETLATFLHTLKQREPRQFWMVEKALHLFIPSVTGIEVEVNDFGEVEYSIREGDTVIPARVVSDGTLRILGLLAMAAAKECPPLVALEEPESSVHPRRLEFIGEILRSRTSFGDLQLIVTTHSPRLLDYIPVENMVLVKNIDHRTQFVPLDDGAARGPLIWRDLDEEGDGIDLPSERMLRGEFGG